MALPMENITVRARAIGAGFGTSSNGNAQIAVQCEVVDHEQYNGESIAWVGHFTDKTTARTLESLQHFGFPSDDLSMLEDIGPEQCAELLPETVELVCAPEEYNGEWTLKVKWVNKPGRGKFTFKEPLTGSGLKAFAAQMKGALRNARGSNGAAKKPAHPNAPGSSRDGGDPPF